MVDQLSAGFHPAISKWFYDNFDAPTRPQKLGWPLISSGLNTLILAPTGSGKTLSAFLAGINRVVCDLESGSIQQNGVEILYISPLKALNYDIERNLSVPLRGIKETAEQMGYSLPEIRTAVRTGDTPQDQRRKMIKKPPHILITTPESLHIMLTSSARKMLETVRYVIVDEIHALSPNKRGVFLSVLLERLEDVCISSPVRIGLSATQKPLSEVALFLGGYDDNGDARKVEIVDTGVSRQMDLKVICSCDDLRHPPDGSVWPSIYRMLYELVKSHRSTIIFANTRRVVEQLTAGINECAGEDMVLPHHGSVSASMRRSTEAALKNGAVRGVVATGTLELGIDMGAVELVCQVESPKDVSRGLQRVGRAGHALKAISKGRIIPKTKPDLAEAVSVAEGMIEGDVEPIRFPKNCLDVLAQQIASMAALESVLAADVYNAVKRSYSFHTLAEEAFNLTLQLVAGRYPSKVFKDLRARVSFDRITGRISPLPGTQRLVIANGGAIPDTGEYGVYLAENNLKIGELDEEFVYEAREGDSFALGRNSWRIEKIEADRVVVSRSSSYAAAVPFWRGESIPRSAASGRRMGRVLREIAEREDQSLDWILRSFPVDPKAADNLDSFVKTQTGTVGSSGLPTDKRIVLESFTDQAGNRCMALISTFGGRIHQALRIALSALMKQEMGISPESISGDNGILFRLPEGDAPPPFALMRMLTGELAYELIRADLPNTALFGLRFRQNATRALLLPGAGPGKRTPLWLQRIKAKDLLQIAKSFDGFPIVVETYRECLQDYLEIDELREILSQVQSGQIEISELERLTPSPMVSSMLLDFQMIYQYEWDQPKPENSLRTASNEHRLVDQLIEGKANKPLDEQSIRELDQRLSFVNSNYPARTSEEFYERVRQLGDIAESLAADMCVSPEIVSTLIEDGRLVRFTLPNASNKERLIASDYIDEYLCLMSQDGRQVFQAMHSIIERYLGTHAVVIPENIAQEYGFPLSEVRQIVGSLSLVGKLVEITCDPDSNLRRWTTPDNLESLYKKTLAVQKSAAVLASPAQYTAFLLRYQHLHPDAKLTGLEGVRTVLRQMEAIWLPYSIWESEILSRRVSDYRGEFLDDAQICAQYLWIGQSSAPDKPGNIAFLAREDAGLLYSLMVGEHAGGKQSDIKEKIRQVLRKRGACFLIDVLMETGLDSRIVQRALWEMIWQGEVTYDYYKLVRSGKPPEVSISSKEPTPARPVDRRQFYRARSKVAKTFSHAAGASSGRWMLMEYAADQTDRQYAAQIYARVLLERYGVIAKDLVQRQGEPDIPWSTLYDIYTRMEMAGEIERGYYVDGLAGAQFGIPQAADDLMGRSGAGILRSQTDKAAVLVNACDPAYLYYASGPFQSDISQFNRLPSNYAVLYAGAPAITLELASGTLRTCSSIDREAIRVCVMELGHLTDVPWPVRAFRKAEIATADGEPICSTPLADCLEQVGFEEENGKMVKRA